MRPPRRRAPLRERPPRPRPLRRSAIPSATPAGASTVATARRHAGDVHVASKMRPSVTSIGAPMRHGATSPIRDICDPPARSSLLAIGAELADLRSSSRNGEDAWQSPRIVHRHRAPRRRLTRHRSARSTDGVPGLRHAARLRDRGARLARSRRDWRSGAPVQIRRAIAARDAAARPRLGRRGLRIPPSHAQPSVDAAADDELWIAVRPLRLRRRRYGGRRRDRAGPTAEDRR